MKPIQLKLKIMCQDFERYIFSVAIIFDCTCVSKESVTPCDYCKKSIPYLTSPIDQTGEVNIQYYPDYISTLDINQYFSAVVAPTREQLNYYQGKRKVNSIDVDCAAVEIQNSQGLHFISNKIKGEGGIFSKSNS